MTGWRARLSALRQTWSAADSAESADRAGADPLREANGAIGTNDTGMESARGDARAESLH